MINSQEDSVVIRVQFPIVQGTYLPADHGYGLYGAISRLVPELHGATWLGVELISGVPWDKGLVVLPARGGVARLRLPADKFPLVFPLAGKTLEIDGHKIRLGIPVARPLVPAKSLYARIVTIKPYTEAPDFIAAASRQLEGRGMSASLEFPRPETARHRRIVRVNGNKIVGFSLVANDLSDEDSIKLQSIGLGGRRAMGCGVFNPIRSRFDSQDEVAE